MFLLLQTAKKKHTAVGTTAAEGPISIQQQNSITTAYIVITFNVSVGMYLCFYLYDLSILSLAYIYVKVELNMCIRYNNLMLCDCEK